MTVAPTSVHPEREPQRSRWVLVASLAFLLGGLAVALLYEFDGFGGSSNSTTDGSGVSATQVRDVAAFDSVELAGSNNVVIRVGEKQSVVVRADDNLLDRVTTTVQSGELVIANTPGSFTTKSPMSVEVAVPTLNALTLTGNGNMVVDSSLPSISRSRLLAHPRTSTDGGPASGAHFLPRPFVRGFAVLS